MAVAVETLKHPSLSALTKKVVLHSESLDLDSVLCILAPQLTAPNLSLHDRRERTRLLSLLLENCTREQRAMVLPQLSEKDCLALWRRGDLVTLSIITGLDFHSYSPSLFEQSLRETGVSIVTVAVPQSGNRLPSKASAVPAADTNYSQAVWLADERLRPFLRKQVAERFTAAPRVESLKPH